MESLPFPSFTKAHCPLPLEKSDSSARAAVWRDCRARHQMEEAQLCGRKSLPFLLPSMDSEAEYEFQDSCFPGGLFLCCLMPRTQPPADMWDAFLLKRNFS